MTARLLIPSGFAVLLAIASSAGCGSDPPPPPRAVIDSSLLAGANGSTQCPVDQQEFVTVGGYGDGTAANPASPINNGDSFGGNAVAVSCSVTAAGAGFNVSASATLDGATGGSISIIGTFTPTGTQNNIRGVFQSSAFGQFSENDCTFTYDPGSFGNSFDQSFMGVAAGRVWGTLHCPTVTNTTEQRVCDGEAELRFENCAQ
jgi:hypothetical protein